MGIRNIILTFICEYLFCNHFLSKGKFKMTDDDHPTFCPKTISSLVDLALSELERICNYEQHFSALVRLSTKQNQIIDFDHSNPRSQAANSNRKMSGIIRQLYIYQMMQKSEEFKKMYNSLPPHRK